MAYVEPGRFKGRAWVLGWVGDVYFSALVFAQHASHPSCELGQSRISQLQVIQKGAIDWAINFDRGWDCRPQSAEFENVVNVLTRDLADEVYGSVMPSPRDIRSFLQRCWCRARYGY